MKWHENRSKIKATARMHAMQLTALKYKVRVRGGGYTAQIYAIRQSIAKGVVAYNQKFVDETSKREIKE